MDAPLQNGHLTRSSTYTKQVMSAYQHHSTLRYQAVKVLTTEGFYVQWSKILVHQILPLVMVISVNSRVIDSAHVHNDVTLVQNI